MLYTLQEAGLLSVLLEYCSRAAVGLQQTRQRQTEGAVAAATQNAPASANQSEAARDRAHCVAQPADKLYVVSLMSKIFRTEVSFSRLLLLAIFLLEVLGARRSTK